MGSDVAEANAGNPRTRLDPLLSVRHLVKVFGDQRQGFVKAKNPLVHAVSDISFDLFPGEVLSLVGESGCGKSTTGRCLLRLIEPTAGSVMYNGEEILTKSERAMRALRKDLQIVFQDPFSSLHPRRRIRDIVAEPLIIHGMPRANAHARVPALLEMVSLQAGDAQKFPHEFSGGQRQRIGIARALSVDPKVVILDEPVSALDVSIQAGVLRLLEQLRDELDLTYLFIAHDLSVVRHISTRTAVMYLGKIVEIGNVEDVFERPRHPYTKALLSAAPIPDPRTESRRERIVLTGEVPSATHPPSGCRFRTRCWRAEEVCSIDEPPLVDGGMGHAVACHFPLDITPATQPVTAAEPTYLDDIKEAHT
jgi:peptide/nickel transport system ATP-binding protein/oligopeptide transport system ATP-binding protein